MPYGMSDEAYAREVDRKRYEGIPLTQPVDIEAYKRGKGGGGSTTAPVPPKPAQPTAPKLPQYVPPTFEPFTPPSSAGLTWEEALSKARGLYDIPASISWEEALKQAGTEVSPMYEDAIRRALKQTQTDLIRRGFFGQLPGLAVTTETQARMEAAKQGKIAELARMLQENRESLRQAGRREQSELARQFMGSAEAEAERLSNTAFQNWRARQQAAQATAQAQYQNELAQYNAAVQAMQDANLNTEAEQKAFWDTWKTIAATTGVIPPMYRGDPSATIRYAQRLYQEASERGDWEGMERAHQMAEEARKQAGWETGDVTGAASAYRMTQAGLPTAEMSKAQLPWTMGPTPAQMLPYQYPTAGQLLPYTQGPTPYEQQRLAQTAARLAAGLGGGGSGGGTLTERTRESLAGAYESIDEAINQGYTVEDIKNSIDSQYSDLVRQGIDPAKLYQYLQDRAYSGAVLYRETPEALETERLRARPLWQKVIDWLPGGQFR